MLARVLRKYVRASVRYKKKVGWDESCVVVEGNQEIVGHSRAWTYKRTGGKVFKLSSPRRLGKGKKGGGGTALTFSTRPSPESTFPCFPCKLTLFGSFPQDFSSSVIPYQPQRSSSNLPTVKALTLFKRKNTDNKKNHQLFFGFLHQAELSSNNLQKNWQGWKKIFNYESFDCTSQSRPIYLQAAHLSRLEYSEIDLAFEYWVKIYFFSFSLLSVYLHSSWPVQIYTVFSSSYREW